MNKLFSVLFLTLALSVLMACAASTTENSDAPGNKKQDNAKKNFAVVELFTSQGCSSCPSADRLLGKYADKENVIAMSFHVDYWNRLGWKDPFSKAEFSQRQRSYAEAFALNGVYTPQVVINGEKEMVGSDENKISDNISKAQSGEYPNRITIDEVKTENNKVTITYNLPNTVANAVLNIALVQNKITTSIQAGENSGEKLTNFNVVRNFKSINSPASGRNIISIDLVPGVDKKELSIVLFIQGISETKVLGAAKSSI